MERRSGGGRFAVGLLPCTQIEQLCLAANASVIGLGEAAQMGLPRIYLELLPAVLIGHLQRQIAYKYATPAAALFAVATVPACTLLHPKIVPEYRRKTRSCI